MQAGGLDSLPSPGTHNPCGECEKKRNKDDMGEGARIICILVSQTQQHGREGSRDHKGRIFSLVNHLKKVGGDRGVMGEVDARSTSGEKDDKPRTSCY